MRYLRRIIDIVKTYHTTVAVKTEIVSSKHSNRGDPVMKLERMAPPKHISIVANQHENG